MNTIPAQTLLSSPYKELYEAGIRDYWAARRWETTIATDVTAEDCASHVAVALHVRDIVPGAARRDPPLIIPHRLTITFKLHLDKNKEPDYTYFS